jgi:hypothetical protein
MQSLWWPLALALLAACAGTVELVPADSDQSGVGTTAVRSVAGIRLEARPNRWPGEAPIAMEVTPLRVTIENNGNRPILIRYSEFALVGAAGQKYAALPPFDIKGSVSQPVLVQRHAPIVAPGFVARSFAVSPIYGPIYPAFPIMDGAFPYDPFYFDRYQNYWIERPLPTADMVQFALPEGRLDPGGRIDGFLYFEKVAPNTGRVEFRMRVVDAQGRQEKGSVVIPFLVQVR